MHLALHLLFSNGEYGDVMPRLLGVILIGLGILVAGHPPPAGTDLQTVHWRALLLPCWLLLYAFSHAPMFLSLFVVVGIGFLLSLVTARSERRA